MVKKMLCTTALLAALVLLLAGLAAAQDLSQIKPTATIGEQLLVRPSPGILKPEFRLLQSLTKKVGPPAYCSPCLFYAGDSDPTNSASDGLWDNNAPSTFAISGVIYTPFLVNAVMWNVTGIGGNIETNPYPPTLDGQDWSIVTGVATGGTPSSTTVLCSGTDTAPVVTDTLRLFFGFYEEYNVTAHVSSCVLPGSKKGPVTYWQTNPVDTGSTGVFQLAYESNVPDSPPKNPFGPAEPVNDSFFYAPAFGFSTFTNTASSVVGPGFHVFSTNIEGTTK